MNLETDLGMMGTIIDFDNCKCERFSRDTINVYNTKGDYLGCISCSGDEWELITEGHNPIKEKWEDGAGNTCCLEGWD